MLTVWLFSNSYIVTGASSVFSFFMSPLSFLFSSTQLRRQPSGKSILYFSLPMNYSDKLNREEKCMFESRFDERNAERYKDTVDGSKELLPSRT